MSSNYRWVKPESCNWAVNVNRIDYMEVVQGAGGYTVEANIGVRVFQISPTYSTVEAAQSFIDLLTTGEA